MESPYKASISDDDDDDAYSTPIPNSHVSTPTPISDDPDYEEDDDVSNPILPKKQKTPSTSLALKKPSSKKKTSSSIWNYKTTSRKKRPKPPATPVGPPADPVHVTPIPRFPDKSDDCPLSTISLSRLHKADRVDLSDDRLSAASSKGFRMVRATRGVTAGAWFFEIRVVSLGPTGHARLGWATEKGDLQAPVGYDGNSYAYRDVDGSKVHRATREKYGEEGYGEGDVIGFYISLPDGSKYAPKLPHLVMFKGQKYLYSADGKEDPPKVVPGSEIAFFKNGVCQGTAFKDIFGGRYYPAASMYTMPNEPNCEVRFNFGPDFDLFPEDFGGRPIPQPMIDVPYHAHDIKFAGPVENGFPKI